MKKVVSHIIGGLGNQMFQYAIARAISVEKQRGIELDTTDFARYPLRPFLLDRLRISAPKASRLTLAPIRAHPRAIGRVFRTLAGWQIIEEREHPFHDLELDDSAPVVYLRGYWQTEKYFSRIKDILRQDFSLVREPDESNRTLLRKIQDCNAVALHIRRGDYVSNPGTAMFHGICTEDYYARAIERLEAGLETPHFFVFSDDIPWARANLKAHHPITFVDHNPSDDPCEDLRLMTACRHFVIANSSFSWWGAWLSEHDGKMVIAPERWFQSQEKDTRDQVPDAWLRM